MFQASRLICAAVASAFAVRFSSCSLIVSTFNGVSGSDRLLLHLFAVGTGVQFHAGIEHGLVTR
jgi:hypothetical protein